MTSLIKTLIQGVICKLFITYNLFPAKPNILKEVNSCELFICSTRTFIATVHAYYIKMHKYINFYYLFMPIITTSNRRNKLEILRSSNRNNKARIKLNLLSFQPRAKNFPCNKKEGRALLWFLLHLFTLKSISKMLRFSHLSSNNNKIWGMRKFS